MGRDGDTDDDSDGGETEADEYFSEDDGYFSSITRRLVHGLSDVRQ